MKIDGNDKGGPDVGLLPGCCVYLAPLPSQHFVLNASHGRKPPDPKRGAHQRSFGSVAPLGPCTCTRSVDVPRFVTCTKTPAIVGVTVFAGVLMTDAWFRLMPTIAVLLTPASTVPVAQRGSPCAAPKVAGVIDEPGLVAVHAYPFQVPRVR